jgi:hypothetical protein
MLVKSKEMKGRSPTLPRWMGRRRLNSTENKIHWPPWLNVSFDLSKLSSVRDRWPKRK